MNPVLLYKELPKTNCGDCNYKTCMAFAVAVNKGDEELQACIHLDKDKAVELAGQIKKVDWREKIIKSLTEEISHIKVKDIADGLGGKIVPDGVEVRCLGRDLVMGSCRQIKAKEGKVTPWEKILLLLYVKMSGSCDIAKQWVSFEELRGGAVKIEAIIKDSEKPMAEVFRIDTKKAGEALESVGARRVYEGHNADYAWQIELLPKIPVLILYWAADEEFPDRIKILFDKTADKFLDVESITFLCENFVKVIADMVAPEE
ncbi:Fe-S cluster domain-containing protein [Candidatus Magnetoovum chiemensis]|nr:Fe-S cluster domain-containing protein [Candidatus Magnetoovum chiemensis]